MKNIKFTWLEDCLVGENIKKQFKNVEFHYLHYPYMMPTRIKISHLSTLNNDRIEKKNTFFSLIKLWTLQGLRKHRNLLVQKMQGKEYLKDAIMKIDDKMLDKIKDPLFFKDLELDYGKIFLDGAKLKEGLPVISYYENTPTINGLFIYLFN